MGDSNIPLSELLNRLREPVQTALTLWDIPQDIKVSLLNVSENITYLVEGPDEFKAVLRVHRENYHTERGIECELEWKEALNISNTIRAPAHYLGKNGRAVQILNTPNLTNPRFMVLFEFVQGLQPDETGDLTEHFKKLGEFSARMHIHSIGWDQTKSMTRLLWDQSTIFGAKAIWGNWRDAPQVTAEVKAILEQVESRIKQRLQIYGQSQNRFGLIHSDMRLANLIVDQDLTWIIDFDDCGFGWYLYDFAAGISFMETDPRIPKLKQSWLEGYQIFRDLDSADIDEVDSFIMLRRMALLAWIGSHIEAPEPQALADGFASATSELGQKYLEGSIF